MSKEKEITEDQSKEMEVQWMKIVRVAKEGHSFTRQASYNNLPVTIQRIETCVKYIKETISEPIVKEDKKEEE